MLLHRTSLANMYGVGVLVIDEIQHLLHAKMTKKICLISL